MLWAKVPAQQWQIVSKEMVVSTLLNAFGPAGIIFALNLTPPERLIGPNDVIAALVHAAGLATFAMTLILTYIVRKRVAAGTLPIFDWPQSQRGLYRYVPRHLILRALVLAVVAIILLVPFGLGITALLNIAPLSKLGFLLFNVAFGAVIGLVMTHFIVLCALADPVNA